MLAVLLCFAVLSAAGGSGCDQLLMLDGAYVWYECMSIYPTFSMVCVCACVFVGKVPPATAGTSTALLAFAPGGQPHDVCV